MKAFEMMSCILELFHSYTEGVTGVAYMRFHRTSATPNWEVSLKAPVCEWPSSFVDIQVLHMGVGL